MDIRDERLPNILGRQNRQSSPCHENMRERRSFPDKRRVPSTQEVLSVFSVLQEKTVNTRRWRSTCISSSSLNGDLNTVLLHFHLRTRMSRYKVLDLCISLWFDPSKQTICPDITSSICDSLSNPVFLEGQMQYWLRRSNAFYELDVKQVAKQTLTLFGHRQVFEDEVVSTHKWEHRKNVEANSSIRAWFVSSQASHVMRVFNASNLVFPGDCKWSWKHILSFWIDFCKRCFSLLNLLRSSPGKKR